MCYVSVTTIMHIMTCKFCEILWRISVKICLERGDLMQTKWISTPHFNKKTTFSGIGFPITETKMLLFWWNFHHWLLWKLSNWKFSMQSVMKISSNDLSIAMITYMRQLWDHLYAGNSYTCKTASWHLYWDNPIKYYVIVFSETWTKWFQF